MLVPWAIPTVVTALLWRFIFDGTGGIANVALVETGLLDRPPVWFVHSALAWVPVILADVWKTTPFVALLLLAGLQNIDPALHEAARIDGAGAWQRFRHVTLPLLRPALLVALIFRTLDAFRVFDLIYVMTGGGPGTSTEPMALYTFSSLLQNLRFGYGSALSVLVFLVTFGARPRIPSGPGRDRPGRNETAATGLPLARRSPDGRRHPAGAGRAFPFYWALVSSLTPGSQAVRAPRASAAAR